MREVVLQVCQQNTLYLLLRDVEVVLARSSIEKTTTSILALPVAAGLDDEVAAALPALQQIAE